MRLPTASAMHPSCVSLHRKHAQAGKRGQLSPLAGALCGAETVRQAEALLDRSERFVGLDMLGADMEGGAMHRTLLAACDKLFAADR
jgi:hypothetical protein